MLTQTSPSPVTKFKESGDCTVNSGGSFVSASTMAGPTINDSSMSPSVCSSSNSAQPTASIDTQKCSPKKLERVIKRIFWGIEVAEELKWKDWDLGKETTRNLILKNVSMKIQRMKYRPPRTKFFFTAIPQPIFLSPGITLTIPIVFRPLERKEYMDQMWFEKEEGIFPVCLRAILPCHKLVCPSSLHLPMCAIGDIVEAWFCLENVGDLPTFFTWELPSPFQIFPITGLLEPGLACKMKVTFQPLVAVIHEVEATCRYGQDSKQKSSIQIRGVGKCAQLLVSIRHKRSEDKDIEGLQKVLHFGPVSVGCIAERQIKLYNPSAVNAPFRIEMVPDVLSKDQEFSCSKSYGIVPPREKKCVSLFFHPKTVDSKTVEYFSILPAGCASQTLLQVIGLCKGPAVSFQHYCVNFSWVILGERSEQILWIENQSRCLAHFQFIIDCQQSVFSISPTFGTLLGKVRMTLRCAFQPTHPNIYFRRVACLIHHQDPLFLDLIGTCHSDRIKPVILKPRHLTWYRIHQTRGLVSYPPDILTAMLREKKLEQDPNGALMVSRETFLEMRGQKESSRRRNGSRALSLSFPVQDMNTPTLQLPRIPPTTEFLFDGTSDMTIFPPVVRVEPAEVDFGSCPGPETPNPIPLCLSNHTKGKITVVWTHRSDCPFWVTPETFDVPPLKSMALRLHFQPPSPNSLYAVELEAFAVYKALWSYSNIEEDCTVSPPWCLTVQVRGHSYSAVSEHRIPQYSLDTPKLFPAVPSGESSYRSLLLENKGSEMLTFNLTPKSSSDITLRPSSGIVAPGAHQIFIISTHPKGTAWKQHIFYLQFNFYPHYLKEVSMQSREEPVQLKLDTYKSIYFKPTWVGCSSTSPFTFCNPTRMPLEFEWRISQQHQRTLAVQPSKGTIHPNETLTLSWIFSPLEQTKYLYRVGMWVWEAGQHLNTKLQSNTYYMVRLVGMGTTASLSAKTKVLDFGNVLVNSRQSRDLALLNQGNCTIYYRLTLEQTSPEGVEHDSPAALHLDHSEGSMPPRSQDTISLTAYPKHSFQYSWTISYSLVSCKDNKVSEKQELCRVSLVAVYPLLSILDGYSMGSTEGITRRYLWRLFNLDTLNNYLAHEPTPNELTYKVPTKHSINRIPTILTPLKLDFNFGAAPFKALPSVVLLILKNTGVVPLDWAFLFPSDQRLDVELWAEQVELSSTELHQMRVEDNCLFSVSPKSGSLCPGEEQMVEFKYSHLFIGTDRLPVLFKVSHGREILLNFIGVTVELDQKYVHFASTNHSFTPVRIGDTLPPRQIYELYNGGSVPVTYQVETSILSQVQEKNFDHSVFCCLNPKGEIQPGTLARILWIFSPIEAKTYTVDVPIHIEGWNSALIHFRGVGYDPNIMGNTAPFHNICLWDSSSVPYRLMVPGQVVFLSQSHVSFGNIPVQSKCSRMLFLNNTSKKDTIFFSWQPSSIDFGQISVDPMEGEMAPEETVPFVVTLQASVHASFYGVDLICKVYRQELMWKYHKELKEWEKEKKRQEEEFIITDRKVKTLPPITNQQPSCPPASWKLRMTKEEPPWSHPQPPTPAILCLSLTARTHAIDYYLANFFSEFPRHFLHWELPKKKSHREETEASEEEAVDEEVEPVSKHMKQLLTDCLTSIIRGLLEDKNFQEAVDQNLVEEVPYFCQFWSEQSAQTMAPYGSLYLMPVTSMTSDNKAVEKKEREEEEEEEEEQEEKEEEEEEEEEEEMEEMEEDYEFEKLEMEEEETEGKEVKLTWMGVEPMLQHSQQSLQWQWSKNLRHMKKEEQEHDEKEAIGRLRAFANLQEALLENMIQNVLVEASYGEVVLTSRPRIITMRPVDAPPLKTDVLPSPQPTEQQTEASSVAAADHTTADPTIESWPMSPPTSSNIQP
ncbi:cilia- and flagella-associated protein 65 isoform X3 [Dipodomys merriami]|uniref:cilia- and flagella-associated protein 65 isoform X3 n=1 Tax=Dipodomys merriami TaxID=94247 RepID=UPI00384FEB37